MQVQQTRSFLDGLLATPATSGAGWLKTLRAEALERANVLSVPSTRDEDWRFTDLTPLYRTALRSPDGNDSAVESHALSAFVVPEAVATLVFIDGHFQPTLSRLGRLEGIGVGTLSQGMPSGDLDPAAWVARAAPVANDLFVAVNTARLQEAAVIHAARDAAASGPVHCLFVSTQREVATHPRLLVVAETGSDLLVVEDHVTLHEDSYCVNAVGEVYVGANARVRHVRLQRDSRAAFHIATTAVHVARDGCYAANALAMGARISRHNLHVRQDGPGTRFEIDGLAMIGGRQLADTHSFVDHAHPDGASRQQHKCVVSGGAHAVFNGRILVREGAQRTDSAQESRNLLLSPRAQVDTKPQLEIFADDVKCAHGATVGQLEAEEVFYLRSRGLPESVARGLLTYGFAADLVDRIPVRSIVAGLRQAIVNHTGGPTLG
jgi:Fe-S cluster assembly protein SufD